MTTHQDLEIRLREIAEPTSASAGHKERLRNQLMERARRRRSRRVMVTVVVAVVAFSTTLMQETPLESVNYSLTTTEVTDYSATFQTHEDSKSSVVFGRATVENNSTVQLPITPDEAETRRRRQETLNSLHAAGQTTFNGITGYEVMGIAHISARYIAIIDSTRVSTTEVIREDPVPRESLDRYNAFLQERLMPYFTMKAEGALELLDTTEFEVEGIMRPVYRFVAQDEEYGEVIIYSTLSPQHVN